MTIQATVNFSNPTDYSAYIPFVRVNILNNDTVLGHMTVKDLNFVPGLNKDVVAEAFWNPLGLGGKGGQKIGRELLSQYISGEFILSIRSSTIVRLIGMIPGWNTTVTLKTDESTIPSQPALGRALAALEVTVPTPRLSTPGQPGGGDGDDPSDGDGAPHMIGDVTVIQALLNIHSPSS